MIEERGVACYSKMLPERPANEIRTMRIQMMKGLLIGAVLLLPLSVLASERSPWETQLPFQEATIHYSISGMQSGNEIKYVRDYGNETATYHTTKTTMLGMTIVDETVEIMTPEWMYELDLGKKVGTKRVNPKKYMIEEYNKLSTDDQKRVRDNAAIMGRVATEGFGGKIQQNAEIILGYSCDRSEMMGTVVYSIHGTDISLRVATSMMGMTMNVEATSVDEGSVDSTFFKLPSDIKLDFVDQADSMAHAVARQTIRMLKDPESMKKLTDEGPMSLIMSDMKMTPEEQEQMQEAMEMLKGLIDPLKQ